MVLNKHDVQWELGRPVYSDTDILKLRDDQELSQQTIVKNKYLNDTFVKDELFKKFSKFVHNYEKWKDKNHKNSVIENWAIWLKTKDYEKNKDKEKDVLQLQGYLHKEGYRAYNTHSEADSFFSSVQHQLQNNPVHKNLTVQNLKELTYDAIQENQHLYGLNLNDSKWTYISYRFSYSKTQVYRRAGKSQRTSEFQSCIGCSIKGDQLQSNCYGGKQRTPHQENIK